MQDEQQQPEQSVPAQAGPKKGNQAQNQPDLTAMRKSFDALRSKVEHVGDSVKALDSKVHLLACTTDQNAKSVDELLTELARSVHDNSKSRGSDVEAAGKALAAQAALIQQTLEATQHLLRCIAADPRSVPQLRKAGAQIDASKAPSAGLPPGLATLLVAIVGLGVTVALWAGLR